MKLINNSKEELPLAGSTLILPAVCIGNVGQLAIDLIIETSQALKVGRFHDDSHLLIPCVGTGNTYSHISGPAFSMELFSLPSNTTTSNKFIVQQRAPAAPGLQQAFADAVVSWAQSSGVAKIIFLGSLDGSFRRDDQLQGSQLCYWSVGNDEELVSLCSTSAGLKCLEDEYFANDKPLQERLTPPWPLVKACERENIPCVAILAFVLEGENIPDAVNVANAAVKIVPALGGGGEGPSWRQPPSWKYVFGGSRPMGM